MTDWSFPRSKPGPITASSQRPSVSPDALIAEARAESHGHLVHRIRTADPEYCLCGAHRPCITLRLADALEAVSTERRALLAARSGLIGRTAKILHLTYREEMPEALGDEIRSLCAQPPREAASTDTAALREEVEQLKESRRIDSEAARRGYYAEAQGRQRLLAERDAALAEVARLHDECWAVHREIEALRAASTDTAARPGGLIVEDRLRAQRDEARAALQRVREWMRENACCGAPSMCGVSCMDSAESHERAVVVAELTAALDTTKENTS